MLRWCQIDDTLLDRIGLYEEERLEGSIYDLTIENHSTLMNRGTKINRIVD